MNKVSQNKNQSSQALLSIVNYKLCWLLFFYIAFHAHAINAEGFGKIQTESGYSPQLVEYPAISLPDSSLQAGICQYNLDDGSHAGKLCVFNGDNLFYIESTRKDSSEGQYGLSGNGIYGINKNYLIVDASMGGASRNGLIFLLKFDEKEIKLLDVIGPAYINRRQLEPMIDFNDFNVNPYNPKFPAFTKIEDIDHDGNPDIKTLVSTDFHFNPTFAIYFSVINDRLYINLNPDLFFSKFKDESIKADSGKESDAYYVYGILSKILDIRSIQNGLDANDRRTDIVRIIGNIEQWNDSFHDIGGDKFVVKTYNLRGR